jgi:CDP-diacylglycerol--glycerol-3-phosphate 3-phosphatidyltransferase
MFDGHWRSAVDRGTRPVGEALQHLGLSADLLTATGLGMSVATALSVGTGHLLLGVLCLVLTGLCDLLDGPVAKAAGTASVRGAFFDSVADRVADALLFGGVSWYLVARHEGDLALLPFGILAAASVISYQRAKAESLGLSARGGLMERGERVALLGVGLLSSVLLIPVLWVMLVLVTATAIGRFVRIWEMANGPNPRAASIAAPFDKDGSDSAALTPPAAIHRPGGADVTPTFPDILGEGNLKPRWRRGQVDSRWRTWRETRVRRDGTLQTPGTHRRVGEPLGRWRTRREGVPNSRTSRAWGTRREPRVRTRARSGRRPGPHSF